MKKLALILMSITFFIAYNTVNSYAINYYDLYFEKYNEDIVTGEYKDLDTHKSYYPTIVNKYISKDEEDAISHVIGNEWKKDKFIKHEQEIYNQDYDEQCVIYKRISGKIIKKYPNWEKYEDITIKIPISIEYK